MCATASTTCFLTFFFFGSAIILFAAKGRSYDFELLPFNWTTRALAGTRIRTSALAAQRQTTSVTDTTVRTKVHQTLDVYRRLTTQIPFYCEGIYRCTQLRDFGLRKVFNLCIRSNACRFAYLLRARIPDTEDRRQCNHDVFRQRNVYACYTCHLRIPYQITRELTLALLMPCVSADHSHNTFAANNFAVSAYFLN
jgi:hypothetical protein